MTTEEKQWLATLKANAAGYPNGYAWSAVRRLLDILERQEGELARLRADTTKSAEPIRVGPPYDGDELGDCTEPIQLNEDESRQLRELLRQTEEQP